MKIKSKKYCVKTGFLLSCFFMLLTLSIKAQNEKRVTLKKSYSEMDFAPNIEGYFEGDIPSNKFCSLKGLVIRRGLKIITFDIYYCNAPEAPVHVVGNVIPDSICAQVQHYCVNEFVTINNVKAVDEDGSIKNLSPLLLRVVGKEED